MLRRQHPLRRPPLEVADPRPVQTAEWIDIEGTETMGQLCAYAPSAPGEFRLVAEITIDGKTGQYASNILIR